MCLFEMLLIVAKLCCLYKKTAQHRPVPPCRSRIHVNPLTSWTIDQGCGQARAYQIRLCESESDQTDSHQPKSRSGLGRANHHRGWVSRVRLTDVLVIRTIGLIPRSTISNLFTKYINYHTKIIYLHFIHHFAIQLLNKPTLHISFQN